MTGVILGPPGSGKGTQAELPATVLGVPHISTGELLRAEAEAGTPLGAEVAPLLAAGQLVPDALTEQVLERRLNAPDAARGALLDGYPRTVAQAQALDALLAARDRCIEFVLVLKVDDQTLLNRLLGRAAQQHRADDNPASIAERLDEYRQLTEPVLDHYRAAGLPIYEVDGTGTVDEVHGRIKSVLDEAVRPSEAGDLQAESG